MRPEVKPRKFFVGDSVSYPCVTVSVESVCLTAVRISGRRRRERAYVGACPFYPLHGRRKTPNKKRVAIRNADSAALSTRSAARRARPALRFAEAHLYALRRDVDLRG